MPERERIGLRPEDLAEEERVVRAVRDDFSADAFEWHGVHPRANTDRAPLLLDLRGHRRELRRIRRGDRYREHRAILHTVVRLLRASDAVGPEILVDPRFDRRTFLIRGRELRLPFPCFSFFSLELPEFRTRSCGDESHHVHANPLRLVER